MDTIAVSINNASKALGIGRTKIYELINDGTLAAVKIGRRTLITVASIRRLIYGAE